jgi:predicted ArsR family transcriptional regulator
LFLASEMDKLVKCHHVEKLYTRYPGSPGVTKKLYYIKNQHHENRDLKVIEKCVTFINTMLEQKNRYFHQQHLSNANNREVPTQFRSYN